MTENYPEVITPAPAWDGSTSASSAYPAATEYPAATAYPATTVDAAPADSADKGTADVAKEQAADLKSGAVEAGQNVAGTAKEQAANVTAEAGQQAKDLLAQAQGELSTQAGQQQQKLASGLRALAEELGAMVHHSEQKGVATDLAHQASERSHQIASWLDDRDPSQLLDDARSFARQRPGTFLAIAAGIGLVAGRMTRGLKAASSDDTPDTTGNRAAVAGDYQPIAAQGGYTTPTYTDVTVTDGAAHTQDTTFADARPFASSQDSAAGDFPIPADTGSAAWSDQSTR